MSRHVKGVTFFQLIALLRRARKQAPLEALSDEASALLEERILPAAWYPFEPFVELFEVAQRLVDGPNDEVAERLGHAAATTALTSAHKAFVRPGDPTKTVAGFCKAWRQYFDFGGIEMDFEPGRARVEYTGYPDVGRCHGHSLMGWLRAAIELAGGREVTWTIDSAPWRGGESLVCTVTWVSPAESP